MTGTRALDEIVVVETLGIVSGRPSEFCLIPLGFRGGTLRDALEVPRDKHGESGRIAPMVILGVHLQCRGQDF